MYGYLPGARCRLFAHGPADATAIPKTHNLLPHLNPDWFYLYGTGLPRRLLKGCSTIPHTKYIQRHYKELTRSTTHTHQFNDPISGTNQVSRYHKGKTNLDFTGARDSEWQRHQLGHMQVCTLLLTDNHASIPPIVFYRPDALPVAKPTVSKH